MNDSLTECREFLQARQAESSSEIHKRSKHPLPSNVEDDQLRGHYDQLHDQICDTITQIILDSLEAIEKEDPESIKAIIEKIQSEETKLQSSLTELREKLENIAENLGSGLDPIRKDIIERKDPAILTECIRSTAEARLALLREIISEEKGYVFVHVKLVWEIMGTLNSHGMQYENIRSGCEEIFLIIMGKLVEFNRVGETVDLIQWGNFQAEIKEKQLQLEDECTKHIKELSNSSVKDFAKISKLNKEEVAKISRKYVEKVKTELDGLVDYSSKFITLCSSQLENKETIVKFLDLFEALYNYFRESRRSLQVEFDRFHKQANSSTTGPKPIQESAESSCTVKDVYNENTKSNNDLTSGHDTLGDNLFVSDKINKPMDPVPAEFSRDAMANYNQILGISLEVLKDPSVSAEVKIQILHKLSNFLQDTMARSIEIRKNSNAGFVSTLDVCNEQCSKLNEPDNFANAVKATAQDRLVLLRKIISEEKGEVFANTELLSKILTQQSNQYQNIRSGYYDNHLVIVRELLGIFRDNKQVKEAKWEKFKGEVKERQLQLEDECIAHTKQISKSFAKELSKVIKVNKDEAAKITQKYVDQIRQQIKKESELNSELGPPLIIFFDGQLEILKSADATFSQFTHLQHETHETIRKLQDTGDQLHKQANSSTTDPKPIQESAESSSTVKDVYNENTKSNNDLTSGHDTLGDNLFVSDKINKPMDPVPAEFSRDAMANYNQILGESLEFIDDPSVSAEVKIQTLRKRSIFLKNTLTNLKEMHESAGEMVISQLDVCNEQFSKLNEPDNFANAVKATAQDRLVLLRKIISEEKGEVFANAELLSKIEQSLTQQSNQYHNISSGYYDNHLAIVRMIPGIFRDKKPVNKSEWETIRGEVKERQLQIENDLFAHTKQVSNSLAEELSKVNKVNKEEVAEITQKYVDQVRQQIKKDVEIHTGIDSQFIHYFDDKLEIIMAYNNSIAHFTGLIDQNLETIRNLHEACDQLHEQASSSTASCSDYPKEIQESLEKVMFHDKSIRIENFKTVFTI